jgi:hypothetical protein
MPSPIEFLEWACMFAALGATLYFLLHEPEDGVARALTPQMHKARTIAYVAALLGAIPGVGTIIFHDGRRNLFAMAVLFNVIIACFWGLRFLMSA